MLTNTETSLCLIGCGDIYEAIMAEPMAYLAVPDMLRSIPITGTAAIAAQVDACLAELDPAHTRLFIAMDEHALNYTRLELYGWARLNGFRMATLVHSRAVLSPATELADNIWVGPGAVISAGCKIGSDTMVGTNARLDARVSVGAHAWLGAGCRLGAGVAVGAHTVIGADVLVRPQAEIGRHCLLEQPGPWQGRVSAGTLAASVYKMPARLVGPGYTYTARGRA